MNDPVSSITGRLNCFALVTYLPNPLASFLDQIRKDVEPCSLAPRAHLTILPPRPLAGEAAPADAWRDLMSKVGNIDPIEVRLGPLEKFPGTNVVYASLVEGGGRARDMYRALNFGALQFRELYAYHPHVTIAQGLCEVEAEEAFRRAREAWESYRGERAFLAATYTFVQNTAGNRWIDLAEFTLDCVAAPELAVSR